MRIAERFQCCAVRPLMILNRQRLGIGNDDDALALTPLLTLRTQKPEDRLVELKRMREYLDIGAAVALDEARQIAGYRKPARDEAILQLIDSPQVEGSGRYIEPRIRVIDPSETEAGQDVDKAPPAIGEPGALVPSEDAAPDATGGTEAAAEIVATPGLDLDDDDDWEIHQAPILGVQGDIDELRDDLALADSERTNFPKAGDDLRVSLRNSRHKLFPPSEAEALKAEWPEIWRKGGNILGNLQFRRLLPIAKRGGVVETDTEEEAVRLREAWAARHKADHELPGVVAQVKWLVVGEQGIDRMRRVLSDAKARIRERKAEGEPAPLLLARQPSTPNGSPEALIARGRKAARSTFDTWAASLTTTATGTTPAAIRRQLRAAAQRLDERAPAEHIERALLHGLMLGATDAHDEMEREVVFEPTRFEGDGEHLLLVANFATRPFQEAIDAFLSKTILPSSLFERLTGIAKRRAFTIAGLARTEMLQTAFDALATSIRDGRDLRAFRKDLAARFESAGWVGPCAVARRDDLPQRRHGRLRIGPRAADDAAARARRAAVLADPRRRRRADARAARQGAPQGAARGRPGLAESPAPLGSQLPGSQGLAHRDRSEAPWTDRLEGRRRPQGPARSGVGLVSFQAVSGYAPPGEPTWLHRLSGSSSLSMLSRRAGRRSTTRSPSSTRRCSPRRV